MPLQLQPTFEVRPTVEGAAKMEWRIHAPQKWRPPLAIHPRMVQLLRGNPETGMALVPLHLGV